MEILEVATIKRAGAIMNQNDLKEALANSGIPGLILSPSGKKLASVRAHYGVPGGQEVLALIDATVFGSAKNGLAFTSRGIYWHNDFMTDSAFSSLSYAELARKKISASKYDVEISGGGTIGMAGSGVALADVTGFLERLQKLERENPQEENDMVMPHPVRPQAAKESSGVEIDRGDLEKFLSTWEMKDIIVAPQGKKLAAAQTYYNISPGEEVLALIDATVFGSAKTGLAVTPGGIYWNNDGAMPTMFTALSFGQLAETEIDTGWQKIKFSGDGVFDISGTQVPKKKVQAFLLGLQSLARGQRLGDVIAEFGGGKTEQGRGFLNKLKDVAKSIPLPAARPVDPWSRAAARPLNEEAYTFQQANDLAIRLIEESDAMQCDNSEMRQTNDAIVRIATLLNEIDRKFKSAQVKDEVLEKLLEESSHKNLRIAQCLTDPNFYVGILGEFSCGKSTFINAMLEERFLVEDVLQGTTCTQTKIRYSPNENIRVIFNDDRYITMRDENASGLIGDSGKKREFLRVMTAEEDKAKDIREVIWEAPMEVLQNGLCIVDTPGIGSQNPRHTEVAQVAAKDCDALLVLTNLDKPLSQELTEAVKAIAGEQAPNCIFIGTRKDQLPLRELNRMRRHFKKRLASHYGHECQFEFVSAYKALEAMEQGGEALEEFRSFRSRIKQILESNRQFIQGRNAAALINEIAQGIAGKFETKVREFDSQISEYEKMIVSEDPRRWETWGEEEMRRFKSQCSSVKLAALEAAVKLVERIGERIRAAISGCRDSSALKEYLSGGIDSTIDSFSASFKSFPEEHLVKPLQKACRERQKAYGQRFQREYKKMEEIFGLPVARARTARSTRTGQITVTANQSGFSSLHDDMESEENMKIGGGMATAIGVSLLVPGVGWAIGGALTLLGGILGAGLLKSLDKRKEEACEKADELMHDMESKLRANVEQNFRAISEDFRKQLAGFIRDQKDEYGATIEKYNNMLDEKKASLQDTQNYIHARMPELRDIAEKMDSQKQKEYFIFDDLDFQEE